MTITGSRLAHPWTEDADVVADALVTDLGRGLTEQEARARLTVIGPNELIEQHRSSPWLLLARQFANTMTVVLGSAVVITLLIGDQTDTVVIAVIAVLNAIVGFAQEYRAEQAMAALKRLTTTIAQVVRDGNVRAIPAGELVPGDLVRLSAGDIVPADLRLAEVHGLRVDEASLTGESEPTAKTARPLPDVGPSLVAEQHNMAFKGTAATYGRGTGIVVASGMSTEIGQIAALLQAHDTGRTPLQRRLAVLGRWLASAALVVCAVVFAAGVAAGEPVDTMFLTAVSLAVAAIPEGLPAVVTVALALGARRMAHRKALIRRLPAVETLGSVSVICSDKTGTLTQNRMTVERIWTPTAEYTVTGSGYGPDGTINGAEPTVADRFLRRLAYVAAACNDAVLHAPTSPGGDWTISGDPTEGALAALAAKLGVERADIDADRPRWAEIGFDESRRLMTTAHHTEDGCWVAIKGAPDALGPLLHPDDQSQLEQANLATERLTHDGYRVLALAERHLGLLPDSLDDLEHDLHLLGLVGIADPPRPEAAAAIATCRAAGITPVMITGDDPRTARAIAYRLGVLPGDGAGVLTGADLDALTEDQLADRVAGVAVYARTNPHQKLRIVNAWKARGAVVAMTGDGVNDAPALRRADIGIAMGITGTEVSKEAADMVLADDNFATIIEAAKEGRRIYDNIRRFVRYMLATNSGEVAVMFLAPIFGLPLPLLPAQILWINLLTDGPPAIALGLEPAEPDSMSHPPRPPGESILAHGLWQHALGVGLLMAAVAIPLQAATRAAGWPWQTMVFTTLSFLQLGNALAVRSERHSLLRLGFRSNPAMTWAVAFSIAAQLGAIYLPGFHDLFHTTPLNPTQLLVAIAASTVVFAAVETEKLIRRRRTMPVTPSTDANLG